MSQNWSRGTQIKNGVQFELNFGIMDLMDLYVLKTVRDYHYFCRFVLENMSIPVF